MVLQIFQQASDVITICFSLTGTNYTQNYFQNKKP